MEEKTENKTESPKKKTMKEKIMKSKGNLIFVGILIILILAGSGYKLQQKRGVASQEALKAKVVDYIKNNLVQPGTDVKITNLEDQGSIYKLTLTVGAQTVPVFVSKDGKQFFPEAMDMDAQKNAAQNQAQPTAVAAPAQKQDVPAVNLFVMSYCPYGTQIEKGILPVISALGSKIKFNLEFVDYSMHNNLQTNDRKELDENLRQFCIQKNQPEKLGSYLTCFLEKGQGTESACVAKSGVNAAQVSSCMTQADSQFNVTKNFKDQSSYSQGQFPLFDVNKDDNAKYGVQGSPTLVINGTVVQAARDSESLLKTICSGFNNPPAECQKTLSSTAPSAGFGTGNAPAGSGSAACGQ